MRSHSDRGFSLLEVSVVIVALIVLVAIGSPVFHGMGSHAAAVVVQSDLHHAATDLDLRMTNSGGRYPDLGRDGGDLVRSDGVTFRYEVSSHLTDYCLVASSARDDVAAYRVSSESSVPQPGTCPEFSASASENGKAIAVSAGSPDACFIFNASTGSIIDYLGSDADSRCTSDVLIPGSIEQFAVTAIGNNAFRGNELTSVAFPDSVTAIGNNAFRDNALISVTLGSGMKVIGNNAFRDNRLASMAFPDAVTAIGNNAFRGNPLVSVAVSRHTHTDQPADV